MLIGESQSIQPEYKRAHPRTLAAIVRGLKRDLATFTQKYGVQSLGVFGSYLRGEQTLASDLDLLVEYREGTPYETRYQFHKLLEDQFGLDINLIENKNLKPYIGRIVRSQVLWLLRDNIAQTVVLSREKQNGKQKSKKGAHMPAKREYLDYIQDMLNGMSRARRYIQGITLEQLLEDEKNLDAVSYALQTVGEAANRIPADVQERYPDIPWRKMIGMRNWIVYGYDVIEYDEFWNTLTEAIPRDEPLVRAMLESEKKRRKIKD